MILSEKTWCKEVVRYLLNKEYEVIMELSRKYSINELCIEIDVNRSGFYKWLNRLSTTSTRMQDRINNIQLFIKYHIKYPSHGYRWLNAKIRLDMGLIISGQYAHRICKYAGIASHARHVKRYGKAKKELKGFPKLVLKSMKVTAPYMVVVSDMTAF